TIIRKSTGHFSRPLVKFRSLKMKNFNHYFAVGGDTNRGWNPWPVSTPATFTIKRKSIGHFSKPLREALKPITC
ncbi:MAG: hypothetical protein KA409_13920, partial [Ferruginibacter sp.]|nr:hypothetical protein [Ferruginibacter sp.]